MANTSSAKKAIRKIAARTEVNKTCRSRIHTFIRKFEDAVTHSDKIAALNAFRMLEPEMMRAVSKGVLHKNSAARKISRLSRRLRLLSS